MSDLGFVGIGVNDLLMAFHCNFADILHRVLVDRFKTFPIFLFFTFEIVDVPMTLARRKIPRSGHEKRPWHAGLQSDLREVVYDNISSTTRLKNKTINTKVISDTFIHKVKRSVLTFVITS